MKKYPSEACSSNSRTLRRYVVVAGLVLSVGLTIAPGAVSTAYADELASGRTLPPPSKLLCSLGKALLPAPLMPHRRRKGRRLPVLPKALLALRAKICLDLPQLNRAPVKRALLVPANPAPPLLVKALLLPRLPQRVAAHLQPRPHQKAVLRLTLQPRQRAVPPTQPLLPLPLKAPPLPLLALWRKLASSPMRRSMRPSPLRSRAIPSFLWRTQQPRASA